MPEKGKLSTPPPRDYPWQRIDKGLLTAKFDELAERMKAEFDKDEKSALSIGLEKREFSSYLDERLRLALDRSNEWIEKQYKVACEVWEIQGNNIGRFFLEGLDFNLVDPLIRDREEAVITAVRREYYSKQPGLWPLGSGSFDYEIERFKEALRQLGYRWSRKLEIAAKEADYAEAQARAKTQNPAAGISDSEARSEVTGSQTGPFTPPNETGGIYATTDGRFRVAKDCRSVVFEGIESTLTTAQGKMMRVFWEAYLSGHPVVDKTRLLHASGVSTSDVRDTWKRSELWNKIIVRARKGTYKLHFGAKPPPTTSP